MFKKIIVFGSNGQLGTEIAINLKDSYKVIPVTRVDCDISNEKDLKSIVELHKPDIVINCAAYTNVDLAEDETEKCFLINHTAVKYLSVLANEYDYTLIHFSTDYVFNPSKNLPLKEDQLKGPINVYGESKLAGENEIIKFCKKYYIFRVCWVYGEYGSNFPKTIASLAKSKEELNVVNDQYGSPTSTIMIASIINSVISSDKFGSKTFGTYHVSPEGCCSWYDVANEILRFTNDKQQFKLKTINAVSSSEFASKAKRPEYSYLNCEKIKKTFKINTLNWKIYLNNFLEDSYE